LSAAGSCATVVGRVRSPFEKRAALGVAVAVSLICRPARAEDDVDAFDVRWELDVPLASAAGLVGGTLHLLREELVTERCAPTCDEGRVNAFDASTLGRYSGPTHDVGTALIATSLAFAPSVTLLGAWASDRDDAWVHALEDAVLLAEVLGTSVFAHQLTAFAAQRPRPYAYGAEAPDDLRQGANTYLSFYSGHTANSFAMATATSYLFTRRHPKSPWVLPLWTFSHGLAVLQGYTRVSSGYHYWSDVLVGAAVGSALGLTIPLLHEQQLHVQPTPGGAGLAIQGTL